MQLEFEFNRDNRDVKVNRIEDLEVALRQIRTIAIIDPLNVMALRTIVEIVDQALS